MHSFFFFLKAIQNKTKKHPLTLATYTPTLNTSCVSLDLWAVKGPLIFPSWKQLAFSYTACLMSSCQSYPEVSKLQILLKLMWFRCPFALACKEVPHWTCSLSPSLWLSRITSTMGKHYAGLGGLLSLGHSCKAHCSFRGVLGILCMSQSHETQKEK